MRWLLAFGSVRWKLRVFSSSWPTSKRPNQTWCFPSLHCSNPTDHPASAPEMKISRLPQLILPHLATLRDSSPLYSRSSGVPLYLRSDFSYTSAGHFIPNASWGRSWLKVFRHSSKPACCSDTLHPRSSRSTSNASAHARRCPGDNQAALAPDQCLTRPTRLINRSILTLPGRWQRARRYHCESL